MPRINGLIPMASPSGMPMTQARRKAPNTRAVEIIRCVKERVFGEAFVPDRTNLVSDGLGEGTNSGLTQPIQVTSHQTKRMHAIETTESQNVFPCPGTP